MPKDQLHKYTVEFTKFTADKEADPYESDISFHAYNIAEAIKLAQTMLDAEGDVTGCTHHIHTVRQSD